MSDVLARVSARFDSYSRTARLSPSLLLLLGPAAVAIGAGAPEWPATTGLAGAVAAMGLPLVLTDWVRRRGQELQRQLWAKWGGNPVVAALREDGLIARKRRAALAEATGLPVKSPRHPDFEEITGSAVRQLITVTRNSSRYPLIFVENKAYGFSRNLLAIRSIGVRVSAVALIGGIVLVGASTKLDALSILGTSLGVLVASLALMVWQRFPSERRVRAAADDYRDRLLEALDAGALAPRRVETKEGRGH